MTREHSEHRRRHGRAFTLTELLVVISLFAILLAVAVPSFSALIHSSEESLADAQLRTGLAAGRDAAVRSDSGDGAAVFFFDPGGRIRIVPCVQVGTINDIDGPTSNATTREVFVPLPVVQPIELPKGWMVRGLVPPGRLQSGTTGSVDDPRLGWYEPSAGKRLFENPATKSNWVFPETGFYNAKVGEVSNAPSFRQTFMVRYTRGSGAISTTDQKPVLVLDPVPIVDFRKQTPWKEYSVEKAADLGSYAKRLLSPRPNFTSDDQRKLLGDRATDTVLAGPVSAVALYQESKLAQAVGARGVNKATGSIYGLRDLTRGDVVPKEPTYDYRLFPSPPSPEQLSARINNWMQGKPNSELKLASEARMYTVGRYLGQAREITP